MFRRCRVEASRLMVRVSPLLCQQVLLVFTIEVIHGQQRTAAAATTLHATATATATTAATAATKDF